MYGSRARRVFGAAKVANFHRNDYASNNDGYSDIEGFRDGIDIIAPDGISHIGPPQRWAASGKVTVRVVLIHRPINSYFAVDVGDFVRVNTHFISPGGIAPRRPESLVCYRRCIRERCSRTATHQFLLYSNRRRKERALNGREACPNPLVRYR